LIRCPKGRNLDATRGIALVVVGLIISIVAATVGEGTVSTVLFVASFLLLVGGLVLLASARRR